MLKKVLQTVLPFKLENEKKDVSLTSFAGLPLVHELFRQLGLPKLIQKWVRIKKRGVKEWLMIEMLVSMAIAGGEHLDDIRILQADEALQSLVGWEKVPTPKTFERFLKGFHKRLTTDPDGVKTSFPLWGLGEVNRLLVHQMIKRSGLKQITLECDATLIESWKNSSQWTYKKFKGYQPAIGVIAELGIIIYDEFRDGNVAAKTNVTEFVWRSLKAIPKGVKIRVRLDGAYYNHGLIQFLSRKKIKWSITANKGDSFLTWVEAIPEKDWEDLYVYTKTGEKRKTGRQWARLHWMSAEGSRQSMRRRQYRYIVTRKTQEQWELYQDHREVKRKDRYTVIATNMDWHGERLIHWHYEKAGSIEAVNKRLKSDLAGGTLPCQEFGANAAWFKVQVLAHNILRLLQIKCLPKEMKNMRLKNLRYHLFNLAGRVVHHAKQIFLKLTGSHPSLEIYQAARLDIAALDFW